MFCPRCSVGVFGTEVEAAVAYDRAVRIHVGPTAPINFQNKTPAEIAALVDQAKVRALVPTAVGLAPCTTSSAWAPV